MVNFAVIIPAHSFPAEKHYIYNNSKGWMKIL